MQRFAVSRITVRLAVDELVRKQLIVRQQGKGTFVTLPTVRHDLKRLHGLLGSLFAQAETASSRLVRYELAVPPRETAALLNLDRAGSALAFDRLYLIDGRPVALVQAWLVPEVAKLPRAKAELISTEDMMRAAGIRVASSQISIRAEAAGAIVGRHLKLSARAPVMVLRRTAFGPDDRVKETGRICVALRRLRARLHSPQPRPRNSVRHPQRRGDCPMKIVRILAALAATIAVPAAMVAAAPLAAHAQDWPNRRSA